MFFDQISKANGPNSVLVPLVLLLLTTRDPRNTTDYCFIDNIVLVASTYIRTALAITMGTISLLQVRIASISVFSEISE